MTAAPKSREIRELLAWLDLERRGWREVDHWDADLLAVGIASGHDARRLVYVSTFQQPSGRFYFECEVHGPGSEGTGPAVKEGAGVDRDELLEILVDHLGGS